MKIFLDANILFSAAKQDSAMSRFVKYLAQNHTVITSDYAQQEAYRNIAAKREKWQLDYKQILKLVEVVPSVDRQIQVKIADKDRPILATAIAQGCDYLITGDKRDFGHLFGHVVDDVKISTPLMMKDALKKIAELT